MIKYPRVYVQPRDAIDCNQLQSLLQNVEARNPQVIQVGVLQEVLLNLDKPIAWLNLHEKYIEEDPTVSVNELSRQLKLWQLN